MYSRDPSDPALLKRLSTLECEVQRLRSTVDRVLEKLESRPEKPETRLYEVLKENVAANFKDASESMRAELAALIAPIKSQLNGILTTQSKLKKNQKELSFEVLSQVQKMIDKSSIDVSKPLAETPHSIDSKPPPERKLALEDFESIMAEQKQFNEFFCSEMVLCRLKWNSSKGKNSRVEFDSQLANTLSANFRWKKHSLTIAAGGFYEFKLGAFGNVKGLSLAVNDVVLAKTAGRNGRVSLCEMALLDEGVEVELRAEEECVGFLHVRRL